MNDNHQTSNINLDECWLFAGYKTQKGYGMLQFTFNGKRQTLAHRVIFEAYKGEIPKGLVLDHLCRVRCCINPEHLEAVTNRENLLRGVGFPAKNARKTHCPSGHLYSKENTRVRVAGRDCRVCRREYFRKWRLKNR